MKKRIVSLVTVAAFYGTLGLGAHTSAKEVTVQKGDTLWGIAKENNILVEDLKDWNGLSTHLIYPEDRLKVALTEEYVIQKGDTLSTIAEQIEGVSWKDLQEWNMIANPDLIRTGDTLTIYFKGSPSSEKVIISSETNENQVVEKNSVSVNTEAQTTNASIEAPVIQEQKATKSEPLEAQEDGTEEDVAMELTMTATAYTASCAGCSGITSTGINLKDNPDQKVISVDPDVIPLGSKVYVEGYGNAIAGDTGGAIQGNKIDIFIPNKQDAINWGVQEVKVKVYK
ncbi:LysM peptidoglycan-binding domain-containing protein [Alkalihalobacillus sp. BA299]|uniref:LysM peptidoglycan-binding domain-containing protein n=1 Tax=Alkalihalobacillus sp. BA299 TaxID=2815938 RepID=UPI001ADB00CA|nr:LysM peptidoglycan-binding domain-containing protein [Alkalihalobacillus sp. BA299]